MYNVSNAFKLAMKQSIKQLNAYIQVGSSKINGDDDLQSFKISCSTSLCKTAMRKLDIKLIGEHNNLLNQWVNVGYDVVIGNNTESLDFGSFCVTEVTYSKDTKTTTAVAYDKMISSMVNYIPLSNITYPITVFDYAKAICIACGLNLGNSSFPHNGNLKINEELWANIDGITYRDIFTQIAEVTGTICIVGNDNNIYFKQVTTTGETLTYDNLIKLKLEDKYGGINSIVLSRSSTEDNVYLRDDANITDNGLTEFKIIDNQIIDNCRESAIIPIYNAMVGIFYYPFEAQTEGLGWYEIGDVVDIVTDTGTYQTIVLDISLNMSGGIKETLKAIANTTTQTQYQYATSISKRIKNAEIKVDKQNNEIQSIVSDVNGTKQALTTITQNINNIQARIKNSIGTNLLRNSLLLKKDSDNIPNWNITQGNISDITVQSNNNTVSGYGFTLKAGTTIKQRISVTNGEYYSFSCAVSKSPSDVGEITILMDNCGSVILFENDSDYLNFDKKTINKICTQNIGYVDIIYSVTSGSITFSDSMFAIGGYATEWTQANGELMNTNIAIDQNGISVKSLNDNDEQTGDYTVMSTREFAGYSDVNGTMQKVFTLNRDVTEVSKLKAEKEITMQPLKIVAVTTGDIQGWAFIPC